MIILLFFSISVGSRSKSVSSGGYGVDDGSTPVVVQSKPSRSPFSIRRVKPVKPEKIATTMNNNNGNSTNDVVKKRSSFLRRRSSGGNISPSYVSGSVPVTEMSGMLLNKVELKHFLMTDLLRTFKEI